MTVIAFDAEGSAIYKGETLIDISKELTPEFDVPLTGGELKDPPQARFGSQLQSGDHPTIHELIDYEAFCGAISEEAADAAADSTITVTTLEQMIKERDEGTRDFLLVDVREENEYEINKIPGSVLIPKGEFLNGNAFDQLPSDKQIVMHCKTGVRSAETLALVKGAGYADAVHVGGGVVAWVRQIDPSQPSY